MLADLGENMTFELSSNGAGALSHVDNASQQDNHVDSVNSDEAALVAAAAAMAAAAQSHDMFKQEDVTNNFATPDLSSYFLAAAAASVQAQQLRDQAITRSEDSYDSSTTRTHTNGTSVHDSEDDDAKALILDQCRKYTQDRTPCPIEVGKRCIGGYQSFAESVGDTEQAAAHFSKLPVSQVNVELGKTRCYWALLSADHSNSSAATGDKLDFVYLDPVLQQHLADQAEPMIGSNFFDYVHPEECDRVRDDMRNVVESRTLFGSVTRCRYSRVPRIRELLGAVNAPRDPEAHRYVEDESFVAIDIVINWIGDGMVLCFFHAIIDKGSEDNEEDHKSDWTNWCGTPSLTFTLPQCDLMWKRIKVIERETIPDSGPVHVFQVIEAGGQGRVLLSWPPPRLFPRGTDEKLVSQSDTTDFQDGSYFADDFARLAQGVSIAPGSSSLSDANTSCTRRFRAKHTLTTEGKVRSIESVLIPYGGVILACFHTTFQQQLPVPDPRLVAQAKLTLQAQAERRRPDDVQDSTASKRLRLEDSVTDGTSGSEDVGSVSSGTAATQVEASPQAHARDASGRKSEYALSQSHSNAQPPDMLYKSAVGTNTQPTTNSTAFENGHASQMTATKSFDERSPPMSLLGGANDPGGSVATLAAVAAAAAAQNKSCTGCGKVNSPEWRRGPTGHKTLCNACGLRYARSLSRRKKKKGKDGAVEFIEPTGDPTVVPKSRGGGGGSLPGVHRKNSKKRKQDGEARTGSSVSSSTSTSPSPSLVKSNGHSSASSAQLISNGVSLQGGNPAANGGLRKASGSSAVVAPTDDGSAAAVSRALNAIAQASSSSDPLALPVSAAISKAIAASMDANGNVGDAMKNLLTTQDLSNSSIDVNSSFNNALEPMGASGANITSPLNPAVSAAALQNMGDSVSEALYNQLVQSGLPGLAPKSETEHDTNSLLSADILQAAAQAAVAHGIGSEHAPTE